ncbi:MAG TPA: hypothetical protein VG826_35880 [Pirellulales bacterium]|nr:hypothetical protein [Pirellulales bacterium]
MPLVFSFEIDGSADQQGEMGSLFERLGWERLAAGTYRYPQLAEEQAPVTLEDWFNHVVPALMLFRCYVLRQRLVVKQFTLEAASSTGYRRGAEVGSPPLAAENIRLRQPTGEAEVDDQRWSALADWLDAISFPLGLST